MPTSGSGPAIMMMPSHIRATFMPDPPLRHIPPPKRKRPKIHPSEQGSTSTSSKSKRSITGVAAYLQHFEHGQAPERVIKSTPATLRKFRAKKRDEKIKKELEPLIEEYRKEQKNCVGEYNGMNCYNTLFVGRLAYEVKEGKLLREFEAFGPVKDVKLITDKNNDKSRGYAFIEFEQEEDMKRAYRGADAMRIEGRKIVVDVERGHTVPKWLPRKFGGGLGGTRLGGTDVNITAPGRINLNRRPPLDMPPNGPGGMMDGPHGGGGPPGPGYGYPGPGRGGGGMGPPYGHYDGGPPPGHHRGGGGPPPGYYNGPPGGRGPPPGYYNGPPGGRGPPPPRHFNDRGGPPPPHQHHGDHRGDHRGMKRGRDFGHGGGPPDRRERRRY
mmetsp:Transcript_9107/g.10002  ORF Transcript_9107/g.10002 Transcript_9107/m.10002 type:complete len:383 (+) Transcript_9107:2-1150(+)